MLDLLLELGAIVITGLVEGRRVSLRAVPASETLSVCLTMSQPC